MDRIYQYRRRVFLVAPVAKGRAAVAILCLHELLGLAERLMAVVYGYFAGVQTESIDPSRYLPRNLRATPSGASHPS